jgi:hypothetical protein
MATAGQFGRTLARSGRLGLSETRYFGGRSISMGLLDSIIGAESGGDPNARNPNSSASGPSQFLDGTWIDTIAKHRPDLAASMSPQELIGLKSDPTLSRDMTAAYAADNAALLTKAGLPVTPGSQYLAHFAGPGGAVGLLNADPSTPAGAILGPAVVKANPFLANMTAGDVAAWAARKVGGAPAAPAPLAMGGPAPAAAAPAQPAPPPQAAPQQQTAASAPIAVPNYDAAPAPFALLPPRPRINLADAFAHIQRG